MNKNTIKEAFLNYKKKYPNKRLMEFSMCNFIDFEYKEYLNTKK